MAYGQLLVASHYDFLTKMLDDLADREQLSHSNEFQLVKAQLDYLSGGKACGQSFSRTDEEYRADLRIDSHGPHARVGNHARQDC